MIEIDGSYLEGGGQIVRTACALAAVTQQPCHIFNIRKGRQRPGLMTQHLLGIKALAELCNAKTKGLQLGSKEIWFYPESLDNAPERLDIKIETAGSITLIFQILLLPSLFLRKPVQVSIDGGATDTFFSPTIDYFRYVFLEILKKMGVKAEINIIKRGFYPEGGARVKAIFYPTTLQPLMLLEKGKLINVKIISGASEHLKKLKSAERQVSGAKQILSKLNLPLTEVVEYYPTLCPGSQINIIGEFENTIIGVDNLGRLGKSAEIVGKEAGELFLQEGKANTCLDKHLADQILPYIALAKGKSEITVSEITNHCKTNIWVIEKFTPQRNEASYARFIKGVFEINGNKIIWKAF
jgi:RNA 3'-phosphate cyclase